MELWGRHSRLQAILGFAAMVALFALLTWLGMEVFVRAASLTTVKPVCGVALAICLIFGRETRGLPEDLLEANWERCLNIPMPNKNVRSLNLANSVGIVLYEALRQIK